MAKDRTYPGEKTTKRLSDRSQLKRINVPGGGEAFSGPTATRALKALGARAMTVDQSIIVDEDFDPNQAEDAALYAHEKLHVDRGSSTATHAVHDAEEVAARAAEEMVLHRMAEGATAQEAQKSQEPSTKSKKEPLTPLQKAVSSLKKQGGNHQDMVEKLAKQVVDRLSASEDMQHERGMGSPGAKGH